MIITLLDVTFSLPICFPKINSHFNTNNGTNLVWSPMAFFMMYNFVKNLPNTLAISVDLLIITLLIKITY